MDDREKLFVDELLDASLQRYSDAGPRPGLEARILAGVRARQRADRRPKTWAWALGMAAAAAVVAMVMISWAHRQAKSAPVIARAPAATSAPAVAKVITPVQEPMRHETVHHTKPGRVDTRPQQFPTPRPLSEQEKLLVEYAGLIKNSPGAIKPDTDEDPQGNLEIPPLSIAAIKIEPLPTTGNADDK